MRVSAVTNKTGIDLLPLHDAYIDDVRAGFVDGKIEHAQRREPCAGRVRQHQIVASYSIERNNLCSE
jgi:hypothetical protein